MKQTLLMAAAVVALTAGQAASQTPTPESTSSASPVPGTPATEQRIERLERAVSGIAGILERLERRLDGAPSASASAATNGTASQPAPQSVAQQQAQRIRLAPGWLVRVFEAEKDRIGESELGEFVLSSYPARMTAHAGDVRTQVQPAYRGEALFVARDPGRYTFQISVSHPGGEAGHGASLVRFDPNCLVELKQGSTTIATARLQGTGLDGPLTAERSGTLDVTEAGAIPVTLLAACSRPDVFQNGARLRAAVTEQQGRMEWSVSIRGPNERSLRPATGNDFVHRE